jgi:hypothetical protein
MFKKERKEDFIKTIYWRRTLPRKIVWNPSHLKRRVFFKCSLSFDHLFVMGKDTTGVLGS